MFENIIKSYLLEKGLTHTHQSFIIAVSGGMDSMALLRICKDYYPIVVYFNHHKRDDVALDISLVKSYCEDNHLTYYIKDILLDDGNFQAEAHTLRQQILVDLATSLNIKHVVTGHHGDDQIETILMRLVRGSDILGYQGLKTPWVIDDISFHKPMLHVSKETISDYVHKHKIPYRDDYSNATDVYLRNRLRHHVIPLLKEENPNLIDAFHRFNTQLEMLYKGISFYKTTNRLVYKGLTQFDRLENLKHLMYQSALKPSFKLLMIIDELIMSNRSTSELDLKGDYVFVLLHDRFYITTKSTPSQRIYESMDNVYEIPHGKVSIFYDNAPESPNQSIKICYNKVALPLVLRHRLPGDILEFSYGRKKLKQLFIDLKIPRHLRDQFVVLVDQNQTVLWVEQLYTNHVLKTADTLYIRYEKDNNYAQ